MADAKHGMKNIGLLGGGNGRATNAPAQYRDRNRQYFADATARFAEEMAPYATDFVTARMQGLVPGDFYQWSTKRIRLSDTTKQGVSLTRKTDDQKAFLVADAGVDYIPEGAKVETMGSYWLVTNPSNLSSATGNGIMRRCNAVWRFLDWYGNIREEPILVEKSLAQATSNDFQEMTLIMQGYFNIICQRNENTEQLDQNSRLILGRRAYQITGYSDVTQEFTGDDESTHLLYFNARMQEPNHEIDDLEAKVAGGKNFSWAVFVTGAPRMTAGDAFQFTAASRRNGDEVETTEAHPIGYVWTSSDPNVATVDGKGVVTAMGEGTCQIKATLEQNRDYAGEFTVTVEASAAKTPAVRFLNEVPKYMGPYDVETLEAALFIGGVQQDAAVEWAYEGAAEGSYSVSANGNRLTVRCWGNSPKPLTVTAKCEGESVSAEIELEGF